MSFFITKSSCPTACICFLNAAGKLKRPFASSLQGKSPIKFIIKPSKKKLLFLVS